MSKLTATRTDTATYSGRVVYKLSEPTTSEEMGGEAFEYIVLSLGRHGDTCVFPSNSIGDILDFVGFGYGIGPSRWLTAGEFDSYIQDCIEQHERDGGKGIAIYPSVYDERRKNCVHDPDRQVMDGQSAVCLDCGAIRIIAG